MAYDPLRSKVVLFGGATQVLPFGIYNAETWEWDGTTWTQKFPAHSPHARIGGAMAYDPITGTVLLYAGYYDAGGPFIFLHDTWAWDGSDWTELFPAHVPNSGVVGTQENFQMCHDEANNNVVLWMSISAVASLVGATFLWDGSDWLVQSPAGTPPHRTSPLAYDPGAGVAMGPGSYLGNTFVYNDTWLWSGTNWVHDATPSKPPKPAFTRVGAYVWQYTGTCQSVVFWGGIDGDDATWTYDGVGHIWTNRLVPSPPVNRDTEGVLDPLTLKVLMFGGLAHDGVTVLNDTWLFACGDSPGVAVPADPYIKAHLSM